MIRYFIGDVATFVDDDCPCGRGLPLLKEIEGRDLDFILRKDGTPISPFRVMHLLEDLPGIAQYKVIQHADYSIDVLVQTREAEVDPLQSLQERCKQLFEELSFKIKFVDRLVGGE